MPKHGDKRYLYSVRGWLSAQQAFPEEYLEVACYVENKERPHESDWTTFSISNNEKAIKLAKAKYGDKPCS